MDMIFQIVVQYVAEILALVIISALGILGAFILNKIGKNKNLENIAEATSQVIGAAQETVRRLQQTLVDGYKEAAPDGKLTPEQIMELKQRTIEITMETLSTPVLELLTRAKVDIEKLITNAAEAYINELKLSYY